MKANSMTRKDFRMLNSNHSRAARLLTVFLAVAATLAFETDESFGQQKNPRVPATVVGYESADLYAKVGGYLKSISVNIGDSVTTGQTLAIIDAPEMLKQLAQKESLLTLAKAQVNQSVAKIEEAKSHLLALKAAIQEAESMGAQKEALLQYEKIENRRMTELAEKGVVQTELLDSAQYKIIAATTQLSSVKAKVATAKANLAGGEAAVRRAEADAAASDANVAVAQADMDYVKQMINYATIRAPWDGKITSRMYDAGAFIQSADGNSAAKPLLKIVRDDKVRVTFSVSQTDIAGLKKGVKVTLAEIDALPNGTSFEGTISRFSAELDPKTRMMRVEMDLDNAEQKLKAGFFGYATIHFN
jgi:multidrug resistance efflux pump